MLWGTQKKPSQQDGSFEHSKQMFYSMLISTYVLYLQADNLISVVDVDASSIVLSHRLTPLNTPPLEKMSHMHFQLQEIIIVGNSSEQVGSQGTQASFTFT